MNERKKERKNLNDTHNLEKVHLKKHNWLLYIINSFIMYLFIGFNINSYLHNIIFDITHNI